jgi:hypothetical protein
MGAQKGARKARKDTRSEVAGATLKEESGERGATARPYVAVVIKAALLIPGR